MPRTEHAPHGHIQLSTIVKQGFVRTGGHLLGYKIHKRDRAQNIQVSINEFAQSKASPPLRNSTVSAEDRPTACDHAGSTLPSKEHPDRYSAFY